MEFKVAIKVEYKSGRYRQVAWYEKNPVFVIGKGEDETRRPATSEELEKSVTSSLLQLMANKEIRSFEDALTNKTVIIHFSDVSEVEVAVEEVAG